jgi:iron complex outermembrane receptor protein
MLYDRNAIAFRLLIICVSQCALGGIVGIASAAEASTQPPEAVTSESHSQQSEGLEEIVVTAQLRTESLKDVPISMQALTGAQLSQAGISDTRDLAEILPTVNFANGPTRRATAFSLRGVSSLAFQSGIQPSTAMVVDGVALARQAEFISQLGDIDRVEVLNGPQGTLFGKNSTAGVVNIVTNQPSRKLETEVQGLVTNDSEYSIQGMVNVPVTDGVRVRVNAFYDDQHPLVKNIGPGGDILGAKSYGASIKTAFDLTDDIDLHLSAAYSHLNSSYNQYVSVGPSSTPAIQRAVLGAATICRCDPTINTDVPAIDIFENGNVAGTLNWKLSDNLSLISISNYSQNAEHSANDSDLSPVGIIVGKGESTPGTGYPFEGVYVGIDNRQPIRAHYVSQEVRLHYTHGPVNALLGAYAQDYHDGYSQRIPTIFEGTYSSPEPNVKLRDTSGSIFGDTTVDVIDSFKVFGGLRFTRERVDVNYLRNNYAGPASLFNPITGVYPLPPVLTVDTNSVHDVSNLSGRAGLIFEPTDRLNFYASYARGYKGPAADVGLSLLPHKDPIIKPEIADAYEIGAKVRLFENRVSMNVALFHEKINGAQLGVFVPTSSGFSVQYLNAGTLTTQGVEADSVWAVTAKLRLNAALAYDDATYAGFNYKCNSTQVATGTCPNTPTAGFQNIDGQQAIQQPKVKYSVGASYSDDLPGSRVTYYVQANWIWNSAIYYELGQDPISREPAHGMLNASVGFKGPGDRWEVQIFGQNLTNKIYFSNLTDFPLDGLPFGYLNRDFQRYGGVRLIYRH